MKVTFVLAAFLVTGALLGGCKSEERRKADFGNQVAAACRQTFVQGSAGNWSADQYCSCISNEVTQNRSAGELDNSSFATGQEAARACLAQARGSAGTGTTGNASTSAVPAIPIGNEAGPQ